MKPHERIEKIVEYLLTDIQRYPEVRAKLRSEKSGVEYILSQFHSVDYVMAKEILRDVLMRDSK